MKRILSLGAGVQSSALLLMSIRGVLPKLDAAIFADTQWEPRDVYTHLEWLEVQAAAAGIPVYRVTAGNLREHATVGVPKKTKEGMHVINLPIFTRLNGKLGKVKARQCTKDYKLRPILKKVMELAIVHPGTRGPKEPVVEQWIGISADEARRIRPSMRRWIVNRYPFVYDARVDHKGRTETRGDAMVLDRRRIQAWLQEHYPDQPIPRSACIGCPYHNNAEWKRIKADPDAWADAVEADRLIRRQARQGRKSDGYLHRSGVALEHADLDQNDLGDQLWREECQGMCGV